MAYGRYPHGQCQSFQQAVDRQVLKVFEDFRKKLEDLASTLCAEHELRRPQLDLCAAAVLEPESGEGPAAGGAKWGEAGHPRSSRARPQSARAGRPQNARVYPLTLPNEHSKRMSTKSNAAWSAADRMHRELSQEDPAASTEDVDDMETRSEPASPRKLALEIPAGTAPPERVSCISRPSCIPRTSCISPELHSSDDEEIVPVPRPNARKSVVWNMELASCESAASIKPLAGYELQVLASSESMRSVVTTQSIAQAPVSSESIKSIKSASFGGDMNALSSVLSSEARRSLWTNMTVEERANHILEVMPFWVKEGQKLTVAGSRSFLPARFSTASAECHENLGLLPPKGLSHIQARVLHPSSGRRLLWDLLSILLIAYDVAVIPLQSSFGTFESDSARTMVWVSRFFWTIDLPVGFVSGYFLPDGGVEMRLRKIAKRYAGSWLPIDAGVVAFDWIDALMPGEGLGDVTLARMLKMTRAMRIVRSVRLVRIAKLPILAGTWVERFARSEKVSLLASMTKLTLLIVALMHFIACLWYGIGSMNGGANGWVRAFEGRPDAEDDLLYRYMTSFHWTLSQFSGSMEVVPGNTAERICAVLVLLLGFIVSAAFTSDITSSMTRLNIISGREASMFAALRDYLLDHKISSQLTMRVQRNARHSLLESRHNCLEKDIELLHLISEPLRMEIHFELYNPILEAHPLFRRMRDESPASNRRVCHSAVCTCFMWPGDIVFVDGEVKQNPEMYFVMNGQLEYASENIDRAEVEVAKVEIGVWVAEPVLWCNWVHQGVFKARKQCELLALSANAFCEIAAQLRNPNLNLGTYAMDYVGLLGGEQVLTDMDKDQSLALAAMQTAFPVEWDSEETTAHTGISVLMRRMLRQSTRSARSVPDSDGAPVGVVPTNSHQSNE